jgi:hypothetical protein
MKNMTTYLKYRINTKVLIGSLVVLTLLNDKLLANDEAAPQPVEVMNMLDNPKKKLRIKLVLREEERGDSTQKKGIFAKAKMILNAILDFSDNPPLKLQVGYEDKVKKQ